MPIMRMAQVLNKNNNMLTLQTLKDICTNGSVINIRKYVEPLNRHMQAFGIDSFVRIRHFIAQVAHESGEFRYVLEIASGQAYEGRKDLGNTQPGDGVKFKGRGLIQITGRSNYERCSLGLFGDKRLLDNPELLEEPVNAVRSACWFWQANNLNALADKDDVRAVTRRINGGYNGLEHRAQLLYRANLYIR